MISSLETTTVGHKWQLVLELNSPAHAKDLSRDGAAGNQAAGTGLLDYDHYLSLLHGIGFDGPLILHGLVESQVEQAVGFLQERLLKTESRSKEC